MNVCPTTTVELQAASAEQNCTRFKVYHCLRDQNRQLTQKCIKPSWIQAGLCAEYNTIAERLDAKPCKTTQGICPQKAYLSNDVISYSACAPVQHKSVVVLTSTQSPNQVESRSVNLKLILPSIIVPLVLIIAMIIFIWILRRGKKRASKEEMELINKQAEIREHLKRESEKIDFFVDDERYVPVKELGIVKKHIFSLSNVVVVGKPGIGKSSLAWNLCKNLHGSGLGNKTCIIKVLKNDIPEIELDEDEKIVLLLDNFLENAPTESAKEKLAAIEQAYTFMLSNHKMVLLFTMSHFDYNRHSEIIQEKFEVVHMEESTVDMGKVLEAHGITVQKNKQERTLKEKQFLEIIENVRKNKPWFRQPVPIGFPLIASIASLNEKFLNEFSSFVEKPTDKICDFVWKLCQSDDSNDKNRFCTIIYAAFKGGKINHTFSHSDDIKLFNSIADCHKVTNAVLEIDKILFRQTAYGDWQFYHESILRVVLSKYGHRNPEFLVSNCPLHVLLRYCTSKKGDGNERKLQIVIEKIDYLRILISRIKKDTVDIKSHIMWEDERFRNWFSKSGNQV